MYNTDHQKASQHLAANTIGIPGLQLQSENAGHALGIAVKGHNATMRQQTPLWTAVKGHDATMRQQTPLCTAATQQSCSPCCTALPLPKVGPRHACLRERQIAHQCFAAPGDPPPSSNCSATSSHTSLQRSWNATSMPAN